MNKTKRHNNKKIRRSPRQMLITACIISVLAVAAITAMSSCQKASASEPATTSEDINSETRAKVILTPEESVQASVDLSREFDIYDYIGDDGVYQASDYIELLKYLSAVSTVYYSGDEWSSWNGYAWQFDCLCLPKSILYWGWTGDRDMPNGGAVYSRRKDYTEDRMIDKCENVSSDFSVLTPGELLYIEGHIGTYIGNGLVIECTDAFGEGGVMVTEIDSDGRRSYNGEYSEYSWELHGFVSVIDYDTEAEEVA